MEDEDFKKFVNITSEFIEVLGNGLPGDIHPILSYLPSSKVNMLISCVYVLISRPKYDNLNTNMYIYLYCKVWNMIFIHTKMLILNYHLINNYYHHYIM